MPQETKVAETQPVQTEIPADTVTEPPATEEQTVTTAETTEKVRQKVNINKADAQEISDKLLIDMDKANAVIELRELISYNESPNELLLCKGFIEKLVSELWDYIEIKLYFIYLLHKKRTRTISCESFLLNNANANGEPYEYQIIYPLFFLTRLRQRHQAATLSMLHLLLSLC